MLIALARGKKLYDKRKPLKTVTTKGIWIV